MGQQLPTLGYGPGGSIAQVILLGFWPPSAILPGSTGLHVRYEHATGQSLTTSVTRLADGLIYDFSDGQFRATPATLTGNLTEAPTGLYTRTIPASGWPDGRYRADIRLGATVLRRLYAEMLSGDDGAGLAPVPRATYLDMILLDIAQLLIDLNIATEAQVDVTLAWSYPTAAQVNIMVVPGTFAERDVVVDGAGRNARQMVGTVSVAVGASSLRDVPGSDHHRLTRYGDGLFRKAERSDNALSVYWPVSAGAETLTCEPLRPLKQLVPRSLKGGAMGDWVGVESVYEVCYLRRST